MINISLDRHDFLYAVEGFAHGSHLRQHVWQEIVYKSIPQMSDDDMDFLWFYMRRDIFERYFYELNGKKNTRFGYEDFMHALAALHRGNRYKVTFYSEIEHKQLQALCYRFEGEYHPLYLYIDGKVVGKTKKSSGLQSFNAFVPNEWIKAVAKYKKPENRHVELGKEEWWNDLEIYDNFKTTYNADFSNIKVGDKIKYYPRFWGDFPHVATVTKVAPKQFKDSRNVIFRKSDGRCINGCYIDCSIATEEDIAEFNRRKLREKMLTEASVLLGMNSFSHKITDEDVQAIYNIINKYR